MKNYGKVPGPGMQTCAAPVNNGEHTTEIIGPDSRDKWGLGVGGKYHQEITCVHNTKPACTRADRVHRIYGGRDTDCMEDKCTKCHGALWTCFRAQWICDAHMPKYGSEEWPCGYSRTGGYRNGLVYVPDPDGNPISNILTLDEVENIISARYANNE